MFWRMFDRTPASMVQAFAIPVRQMLAKRIFRHCGKDVTFHHNVLFSKGSNISVGDNSLINRYVMLDDRSEVTIGSFVMVAAEPRSKHMFIHSTTSASRLHSRAVVVSPSESATTA